MNRIAMILMERDGISEDDAFDMVINASRRIMVEGEDPKTVLKDLGLEPDYAADLQE